MFKKIKKLTKDQIELISKYRDEGLKIGLTTEDNSLSFDKLKTLVSNVYSNANLNPPEYILYLDSPIAGLYGKIYFDDLINNDQIKNQVMNQVDNQVWDQVEDQVMILVNDQVKIGVRDQINQQTRSQDIDQISIQNENRIKELYSKLDISWGNQEIHWLIWAKYNKEVLNIKNIEQYEAVYNLFSQVGWCYFWNDLAIITKRPIKISRNSSNRLHNLNGAAIEYTDGFKVYSINGVQFSGEEIKFVESLKENINSAEVLKIKNTEQRSEIMRKIGLEKFFSELNKKELDRMEYKGGTYILYEINLENYQPMIFLKMDNPSVPGDTPFEAVPPNCKTVLQSLNWRNFGIVTDKFIFPLTLT